MEPIEKLINSATHRIGELKQAEFTPQAELAQLELLLAQVLMQYMTLGSDNVFARSK